MTSIIPAKRAYNNVYKSDEENKKVKSYWYLLWNILTILIYNIWSTVCVTSHFKIKIKTRPITISNQF